MDLTAAMYTSESGMKAQAWRLKIVAQNIANQNSTATEPGGEPYRRKTIFFNAVKNNELGVDLVQVNKVARDLSEFNQKFDPSHPAANENGYVLYPNINNVIEIADSREASLYYEANLATLSVAKDIINKALDVLNVR